MNEHHLKVSRTARYFSLGNPGTARHVWIACHGYSQLARQFLGYLATLASAERLIVAPEALSRFYLAEGRGAVGASWMTKEDREHEIADYVGYLDTLHAELAGQVPADTRFHLLGFSQGVATAARWLEQGARELDGVCFWAGTIPTEVDPNWALSRLSRRRVALSVGQKDEFVTPDWLEREQARFSVEGAECRRFPFHGGHRMDRVVLAQVAGFLESD